jgi:integrase/recombinase XerD
MCMMIFYMGGQLSMRALALERTLSEDGKPNVVLVDENYNIIEEVCLYLHYLELKGMSLNTLETYCGILKEYFTWLDEVGLRFYEVTKRDMSSCIRFIQSKAGKKTDKSPRTVNKYLAVIASFYRYYEGVGGYISDNPVTIKDTSVNKRFFIHTVNRNQMDVNFFRQKETKKKNTRRLFREQIDRLYEGIEDIYGDADLVARNRLLFRILYETGIRIGECLGLRINDYSDPCPLEPIGIIRIRRHQPLYHKDHELKSQERDIHVSMDLLYAIDKYLCHARPQKDSIDTIFVNHGRASSGKFMMRSSVEEFFKELSKRMGVKCTPHMLRHTHGTELSELGYNSLYIKYRLGHKSIHSTEIYIHPSLDVQRASYEKALQQRKGLVLS